MATKTKTKPKSKKPLTVPRRTNLPKLSLLPAPKPVAPKAESVPAPMDPIEPTIDAPASTKAASAKTGTRRKATKSAPASSTSKPSALNAAAEVLADADTPMTAPQLIAAMAERKLWISPGGKTPGATLHAAISKEIATKGIASRFRKVGRGLFAATPSASDSTPAEVAGIAPPAAELS